MHLIATQVDDSREQLRGKLAAQGERPGYAIDPYFYRSHLVHELELEHLIFKSWIYALHSSEIPEVGDYQILEIGEDAIIVVRVPDGSIKAMHNICRHRGARVCEGPFGQSKNLRLPLSRLGLRTGWFPESRPRNPHHAEFRQGPVGAKARGLR